MNRNVCLIAEKKVLIPVDECNLHTPLSPLSPRRIVLLQWPNRPPPLSYGMLLCENESVITGFALQLITRSGTFNRRPPIDKDVVTYRAGSWCIPQR